MSEIGYKEKFLKLDEVRVTYDKTNDSIHLTAKDADFDKGDQFHVVLNKGTETEKTLRKLLVKNEVIPESKKAVLPKRIKYSSRDFASDVATVIPIGVDENSNEIQLDLTEDRSIHISGQPGSGKTNLINLIKKHSSNFSNEIELHSYEYEPFLADKANSKHRWLINLKENLTNNLSELNSILQSRSESPDSIQNQKHWIICLDNILNPGDFEEEYLNLSTIKTIKKIAQTIKELREISQKEKFLTIVTTSHEVFDDQIPYSNDKYIAMGDYKKLSNGYTDNRRESIGFGSMPKNRNGEKVKGFQAYLAD